MARLPHFDKGVLSGVAGILLVAQHAECESVDVVTQAVDQVGECPAVVAAGGGH